jgi:spore coat protein A
LAPITRRVFLAGAAAAAVRAQSLALDPNKLEKFVDALPIPPVARSAGRLRGDGGAHRYRLEMSKVMVKVHRDLPSTPMWGYNGSSPGPVIETRSGQPVSVQWVNTLPRKHFLPVDHNLHGAEKDKPEVRSVVHVHGAKTTPESDGYPEEWTEPGKAVTYSYPNNQDAATLWYHDHAMGINRLNIYAGLFGMFLIRDDFEESLKLPNGQYEIPLMIYDRSFRLDGQLDYPDSGIAGMPWVPEAFGEAMLVNGKLFPHLEVEPRKYRFRLLNASNGRFFHLSLSNGQKFIQIGTEQGLMAAPLAIESFVVAPGERFDLVIDFAEVAGEQIVLRSDAFEIMQFRVSNNQVRDDSAVPPVLRPVVKMVEALAVKTRSIPLLEFKSPNGDSMTMLLNGMHWDMPVTENPVIDTVEIWEFINTTEDSHPIHLHMVRFQILDRQAFDEPLYYATRRIRHTGPVMPPDPYEAGWKDTVRAHSKMITRIIVRFEGYTGRYVWHCHVLEHEDNEMMRPYDVLPQ